MDGGRAGSGSGSASGSNSGTCPFLRRHSVKRSFSTMAETRRRSSSPDSLFVSPEPDPHYNNSHAAQRHTHLALPRNSPHRTRYPGDGLDFRRPVTTSAGMGGGSNVIDLTEEDDTSSARDEVQEEAEVARTIQPGPSRAQQRLPNFQSRNIIDVESDVESEEDHEAPRRGILRQLSRSQSQHQHPHHPEMDRPRRQPANMDARSTDSTPAPAPARRQPVYRVSVRSITPHPTGIDAGTNARGNTTIDLTEDDDDVVITDARPRVPSQLNMGRPVATAGTGTRAVLDRMFNFGGPLAFGAGNVIDRVLGAVGNMPANRGGHFAHAPPQIPHAQGTMMIDMNYMAVGFEIGDVAPPRPATPKYEPPPAAEPGFTRSPKENEEVVCPNCGDELCMGDNDIKQQVWVIKSCGHAYCGECAHNRTAKKPKGKGKAKVDASTSAGHAPMKKCQVIGCASSVTGPKQMLRVYVDG